MNLFLFGGSASSEADLCLLSVDSPELMQSLTSGVGHPDRCRHQTAWVALQRPMHETTCSHSPLLTDGPEPEVMRTAGLLEDHVAAVSFPIIRAISFQRDGLFSRRAGGKSPGMAQWMSVVAHYAQRDELEGSAGFFLSLACHLKSTFEKSTLERFLRKNKVIPVTVNMIIDET